MTLDRSGPYCTEDGSEVYLPVGDWTFNEARREAASFARMEMGDSGRARYTGKRDVPLHDHEDWWDCQKCGTRSAWCFETYEGTSR